MAKFDDDIDWGKWGLEVDGATINDKGKYVCSKCDKVLEPVIAGGWKCQKCNNRWLELARKARKREY